MTARISRSRPKSGDEADNAFLGECLAQEAERATGHMAQALRKAARKAHLWPMEAKTLHASDQPLTVLDGVGPYIARLLAAWIESPPVGIEIPPLRQEFLTMATALRLLKAKPGWKNQLKGDLQMHTRWSDGEGEIEEMAAEGIGRGYRYIGITDHTKGLSIAGGMDEAQLARQGRQIDALNKRLRSSNAEFVVLKSAEVNLSVMGEADMSPASLRKLDVVLGAFHSALRRTDDQTHRYVAALRNPHIHILGHPQTRIYNHRLGLKADWPRVFAEAARLDKAVEIDGYADRQDLKLSFLKLAKREGCRVSLGTDSHRPSQMEFIHFCLAAAVLAKLPSDRILNFMTAKELKGWVARIREK